MDLLDSNDVTQGEEAPMALLALMTAGNAFSLLIAGGEDDEGQPMVIIEAETETFALDPEQAVDLLPILARMALKAPRTEMGDEVAKLLTEIGDSIHAVLTDLIGAGGETVH